MTDKIMSEKELSKRWGVSQATLQRWRKEGSGPKFSVIGKNTIRYMIADVVAYEEERSKTKQ